MKALIVRFVNWRLERQRARAVKSTMHTFMKLERRLSKILRFFASVLYPLTMSQGMFCYMGVCSSCSSPASRFYIPILGQINEGEYYPADRTWYVTRHTLVCPHCNQPFNTIGIYKSVDALKQRLAAAEAEVAGGEL